MAEFEKLSSEEPVPKPEKEDPAGGLAPPPESEKERLAQPEASGEPETETVIKLSKPSKELATRLLGKVSFKDRITGISGHPMGGEEEQCLYRFADATDFLHVSEDAQKGFGWVRFININALKKWVGETLGDIELAQAIGETTKELDTCPPLDREQKVQDLVFPVKALMQQRLEQCEEIIGGETKA